MLKTNLCGITLKNPLLMASGTFGFGEEFSELMDLSALGGICSKGLTLHPREGNYGPRMLETPAGMLNSVGLQNPGIPHFLAHELPLMRSFGTAVIANMGGMTLEEYIEGAQLLAGANIDMLELNISCPNVKHGGAAFGIKADVAYEVVCEVRKVFKKPLMVKLSPAAENIREMALACERAGADALSLINTLKGFAINLKTRKPFFRNGVAGLSGPCVKPVALHMVYEAVSAVSIPVVGLGGITTANDALEFIMAGATAVQIGTANFIKPGISLEIAQGIEQWMRAQGVKSLEEIRGCAQG